MVSSPKGIRNNCVVFVVQSDEEKKMEEVVAEANKKAEPERSSENTCISLKPKHFLYKYLSTELIIVCV